ncbi:hypothetical protein HPU229334_00750 [Helicobacter pullorum]|uniref:Uncharacterized protein n=1 Tax=Helicobacter pullorum TaxID=35818 RepID=A0A0N0LS62_9HELI|nr:hypothetical protein [Helicobacter pullorum]KPH54176.1 hypothetical protein HPU229334_00750 [Helicobacter pullorum]
MYLKVDNAIVDTIYKFYNGYELKSFSIEQDEWCGWCYKREELHYDSTHLEFKYVVRYYDEKSKGNDCGFISRIDMAGGMMYSISTFYQQLEESNSKASASYSQSRLTTTEKTC